MDGGGNSAKRRRRACVAENGLLRKYITSSAASIVEIQTIDRRYIGDTQELHDGNLDRLIRH
jgi:hypothetical protein